MATSEKTSEKSDIKEIKGEAPGRDKEAAPARDRDPVRDKAIDLAVSTIEKQFGKGSIMRLGEGVAPPEVKGVPTGSLGLDIALGWAAYPAAASSRCTGRSPRARPPWPCTWWPRPRRPAASAPSSTPSTRW